jgi:hypothetical protein
MIRLETEVKQITHAIRMAAYNTETTLARALHGHYARAGDEAYALTREALAATGDIIFSAGQLLVRLDPLTAPRRTQALAALCDQLTPARACYPGTDLVLRSQVKPHPRPCMIPLPLSGVLIPRRALVEDCPNLRRGEHRQRDVDDHVIPQGCEQVIPQVLACVCFT